MTTNLYVPSELAIVGLNDQFWWYLARASGTISWAFLTASVLWGILLSTDLFPKRRRPAWLLDLHRWLGGLTVTFALVHVGALIADSYVDFGLVEVLLPFASEWKPAAVALGVIAMWGLMVIEGTSLLVKRLPKKIWRVVHLGSYILFWLTSLHATFAGTDANGGGSVAKLYLVTSSLSVVAVVFALTYRVLHRGRHRPLVRT